MSVLWKRMMLIRRLKKYSIPSRGDALVVVADRVELHGPCTDTE
jgi:hypothetical protein